EYEEASRDPKNPRKFIPKPPALAGVEPHADVELVWPLGRFGRLDYEDLGRELDALWHLGETPLYLSIVQAIDDLKSHVDEGETRIVAITDGCNDQSDNVTLLANVQERLREYPEIKLDIVGFRFTPKNDEEKAGREELQSFADDPRRPRVTFTNANDASGLLARLRESLALTQYLVRRAGAGERPDPVDLGKRWVVDDHPAGRPVEYEAWLVDPRRQVSARFDLGGGEALELFLDEDRRTLQPRLIHHRYGLNLVPRESRDSVPDPQDPNRRFFVGVHTPERKGSTVTFQISLQNFDATQFSPRPKEAWIEIVPIAPEGPMEGRTYVFYDLNLKPDRPVPVLEYRALDWPTEANGAHAWLWCKLEKTAPDEEIDLADLPQEGVTVGGATFDVQIRRAEDPRDPDEVTVIERHPDGGDFRTVKVEMSPPPATVSHRFSPEIGLVRHIFKCEARIGRGATNQKILITTRESLARQAISLSTPLEITTPKTYVSSGR
ncbi:MAG: vWA domain-containing protein, partial [Planctomycetota bacterium]